MRHAGGRVSSCDYTKRGFLSIEKNRSLEEQAINIAAYGISLIGRTVRCDQLFAGLTFPFFVLPPQYIERLRILISRAAGSCTIRASLLVENVGLSKWYMGINDLMNRFSRLFIDDHERNHVLLEDIVNPELCDLPRLQKPIVSEGNRTCRLEIAFTLCFGRRTLYRTPPSATGSQVNNGEMRLSNLDLSSARSSTGLDHSRGHGVLAADAAHPTFDWHVFPILFLRPFEDKRRNCDKEDESLDIGDVFNMAAYSDLLDLALREEGVDGVGFIVSFSSEREGLQVEGFVKKASEIMAFYDKPVALCVITNKDQWFGIKQAADIPVFSDIDTALDALQISFRHWKRHDERPRNLGGQGEQAPGRRVRDRDSARRYFTEPSETFELLKQHGVPTVDHEIVRDAGAAIRAARRIGYPIALKIASGNVLHKTERGGVKLNITGDKQLEAAFCEMEGDSFIVQKMAPPGRELIIGARADKEFGPVILLGLGGIFAELLKDVSMRILPIDREIAREMINQLRGAALLKGFRGQQAADLEALEETLLAVSRLCVERSDITNLDINPLILYEEGRGCVAVDVKLELTV